MYYSDEEWAIIEKTLPGQIDDAVRAKVRTQLDEAARRFLQKISESIGSLRPPARERIARKEWIEISKGASALEQLYRNRNYDDLVQHSNDDPLNQWRLHPGLRQRIRDALVLLRIEANAQIVKLAIEDEAPKASAKAWFHFDVLRVWTSLGGKLRFSRHPTNGTIRGPLTRYFSAVTGRVHGGSIETLPDIVRRHTKLWLDYMQAVVAEDANWAQSAMTEDEVQEVERMRNELSWRFEMMPEVESVGANLSIIGKRKYR